MVFVPSIRGYIVGQQSQGDAENDVYVGCNMNGIRKEYARERRKRQFLCEMA